jgi:acetoin utilization deacetylase AcuC-like enzyme
MPTHFLSHDDCEKHVMLAHHPESPARLVAIREAVDRHDWQGRLHFAQAEEIAPARLADIHPQHYIDQLEALQPGDGIVRVDADTSLNRHSLRAAKLAAGAVCQAVEAVMEGQAENAFCAIRPPGHHAETALPMGFCVFNNIALAAQHALDLGAERIAIFDFDVHHGNGTVEIFLDRPEVMVCSSFQYPFYPGRFDRVSADHIVLSPLEAGTASDTFRRVVERDWLPAIERHRPDLVLVSAGFDAHRDDPLGGLCLVDEDYYWVTGLLRDAAQTHCEGRLVSALEGGYNLEALARSATAHLRALAA